MTIGDDTEGQLYLWLGHDDWLSFCQGDGLLAGRDAYRGNKEL